MRLFLVEGGRIVDRKDGPGIGQLTSSPIAALRQALVSWLPREFRHVALCGMAGSRNGVVEVPYADCPAGAPDWIAHAIEVIVDGVAVTIAPGLAGEGLWGAPDVMRGEETQIFGAIDHEPSLAKGRHLLILPGTHSKWAMIEDGAVTRFQTFVTGELFALLSEQSTLTRTGGGDDDRANGFMAGLDHRDCGLTGAMFAARSRQLREGRTRGWAMGFLSGLLIGREIDDAVAALDDVAGLTLIGDPALTALYRRALQTRNLGANDLDGDTCSIAGLSRLAASRCYEGSTC
jgi:2-dehydro-3-deoxygalactonokinase